MAFSQTSAKHYLIFLWISVGLMIIVSPLAAIYEDEISESPFLILLMMLIMIPTGIAYLSLASETVRMLKSKLLFLAPLLFFPYFLIVVISFAPFVYLIYLTHGYKKLAKQS